jgi:arylsulfatase A
MKQPTQTRREFIRSIAAAATPLALSGCLGPGLNGGRKPNFVVIFTDDQGYGDIGSYGARGFSTPNLDRLSSRGVRFSDFYVAATVCTPSRAALLTGCYPKRVGLHEGVLFPFSEHGLGLSERTIAEELRPLGYRTACVGKWHLGHHPEMMPNRQGFDYFYGVPYSNDMDGHQYRNPHFKAPPLPLFENDRLIASGPKQAHLTRRYTEAATRFIRESGDAPFFLYLAHSMPHLPLHVSENFAGSSERGLYGDVIEEIDWSVGEIVRTLEDCGIDGDTLVIFTSDNGPVLRKNAGTAGPLRGGKASTWEGGQRVPCIAAWPGRTPAGTACRELATTMDLLPTFVSLAGGHPPGTRKIDGHDISALLFSPRTARTPSDAFYYYGRDGKLEAIREGSYKLHTAKSRGWGKKKGPFPVSLYDLNVDVAEKNNIAEDHPDLVERLREKMRAFDETLSREARPAGRLEKTTD